MQLRTTNSEFEDSELCFQDNKVFEVILRVGIRVQAACCIKAGGIKHVRDDAGDRGQSPKQPEALGLWIWKVLLVGSESTEGRRDEDGAKERRRDMTSGSYQCCDF